jgi:hypothetical protein
MNANSYSYAKNCPLMYTDPTGQRWVDVDDIWDFDRNGDFIGRIPTTEFDQIRVLNDDKTVFAETEKFKFGTIRGHNRPTIKVGGVPTLLDIFDIVGDGNARQIFEFFHNNTNTEWTHAKIGFEGSGNNIVGTSHSTNSTAVGDYLLKNNYTLKEVIHNHHSNNPMPSGLQTFETTGVRTMDLLGAESYLKRHPNLDLYIYTTKYGYSPYNHHGTLDPRIFKLDGRYVMKP